MRVFLLALAMLVPAGPASGQSVTSSWDFVVGPLTAGRVVRSVSSVNVGTNGSVAVTLTVDDGSFGNTEYQLYWISSAGDLIWGSGFISSFPVALAIRPGLLVYQEGDRIASVVKPDTGPVVVGTVTTAAAGNVFSAYSIEQGRTPGVLAVAEVEDDKSGFTLHAYQLTPRLADVELVGSVSGVLGGRFVMQFQSQAGVNYQFQSSEDLLTWLDAGAEIVGDGSVKSLPDDIAAGARRFFRVIKR